MSFRRPSIRRASTALALVPALLLTLKPVAPARAENPDPISRMIEKDYPMQGMVGVMGGEYSGGSPRKSDLNATPMFYLGLKQVADWSLFDTPVELDLGRSLQLSLRNIGQTPWSAGLGFDYNLASIRERNGNGEGPTPGFIPGYDLFTYGPYAFTRYQATHALGLEFSERLTYNQFHDGKREQPSAPYKAKNYYETESRLLVDVDLRRMDPRPEVMDSGFYAGVYGFARQRPSGVYDRTLSFRESNSRTYGVGGLGEYLWQPWISGNFGIVTEGEIVANPDRVYLGETDGSRSQGHLYPHLLINQNIWPGGSAEVQAGPEVNFARFGQSGNNPTFLTGSFTLGQAMSKNVSVGITYRYDADPYKETRTGLDQTGSHYVGATTMYHF